MSVRTLPPHLVPLDYGSTHTGAVTGTHIVHVMCIRRGMLLKSTPEVPMNDDPLGVAGLAPATFSNAVTDAAPVSFAPAPVWAPSAGWSRDDGRR